MPSFSTAKYKIEALKNIIQPDSISPAVLGEHLQEVVEAAEAASQANSASISTHSNSIAAVTQRVAAVEESKVDSSLFGAVIDEMASEIESRDSEVDDKFTKVWLDLTPAKSSISSIRADIRNLNSECEQLTSYADNLAARADSADARFNLNGFFRFNGIMTSIQDVKDALSQYDDGAVFFVNKESKFVAIEKSLPSGVSDEIPLNSGAGAARSARVDAIYAYNDSLYRFVDKANGLANALAFTNMFVNVPALTGVASVHSVTAAVDAIQNYLTLSHAKSIRFSGLVITFINTSGVWETWRLVNASKWAEAASWTQIVDFTPGDKASLDAVPDAIVEGRKLALADLFAEMGAKLDNKTGLWSLNGVNDLTYDEMCYIHEHPYIHNLSECCRNYTFRTNRIASSNTGGYVSLDFGYAFTGCKYLVNAKMYPGKDFSPSYMIFVNYSRRCFYGCESLVNVLTPFALKLAKPNECEQMFGLCYKLEKVLIRDLSVNLDLPDSPLINLESFQYLVNNAKNSSDITVTVHPDVYAKLTDPDNTEWNTLLNQASTKNISFAEAQPS